MAGNRDRIMRIAHRVPRINTFHGVKRRLPDGFYLTFGEGNTHPNSQSGTVSSRKPVFHKVDHWVESTPKVHQWAQTVDVKSSTLSHYKDHIYLYWNKYLSSKYADIETWVNRVKQEQKSDERFIVNAWADELKHFFS